MVLAGLSRDDSKLIGFVINSVLASAITTEEMRQWALYMIDKYETDELPLYMFDLMDFNEPLYKIIEIIGFSAGWKHSKADGLVYCIIDK
jgi:hypothetical protein